MKLSLAQQLIEFVNPLKADEIEKKANILIEHALNPEHAWQLLIQDSFFTYLPDF